MANSRKRSKDVRTLSALLDALNDSTQQALWDGLTALPRFKVLVQLGRQPVPDNAQHSRISARFPLLKNATPAKVSQNPDWKSIPESAWWSILHEYLGYQATDDSLQLGMAAAEADKKSGKDSPPADFMKAFRELVMKLPSQADALLDSDGTADSLRDGFLLDVRKIADEAAKLNSGLNDMLAECGTGGNVSWHGSSQYEKVRIQQEAASSEKTKKAAEWQRFVEILESIPVRGSRPAKQAENRDRIRSVLDEVATNLPNAFPWAHGTGPADWLMRWRDGSNIDGLVSYCSEIGFEWFEALVDDCLWLEKWNMGRETANLGEAESNVPQTEVGSEAPSAVVATETIATPEEAEGAKLTPEQNSSDHQHESDPEAPAAPFADISAPVETAGTHILPPVQSESNDKEDGSVAGMDAPPPSLTNFLNEYWITPTLSEEDIVRTPWSDTDEWRKLLERASIRYFAERDFSLLHLISVELQKLPEPWISPWAVKQIHALWSNSCAQGYVEWPELNSPDLRTACYNKSIIDTPYWRLRILLEVLLPTTGGVALSRTKEFRPCIDMAGFNQDGVLRDILITSQHWLSKDQEPLAQFKAHLKPKTAVELQQEMRRKRVEFEDWSMEQIIRFARKLVTEHCRRYLSDFGNRNSDFIRTFYPSEKGGATHWNTKEVREKINEMRASHHKYADEANVLEMDRKHIDQRVDDLAERIHQINLLEEQLTDPCEQISIDHIRDKLAQQPVSKTADNDLVVLEYFVRELLEERAQARHDADFSLTLENFLRFPSLLSTIAPAALRDNREYRFDFEAIAKPCQAAATVLVPGLDLPEKKSVETLIERVLDSDRFELAELLMPKLEQRRKTELARKRTGMVQEMYRRGGELYNKYVSLSAFATADYTRIGEAVREQRDAQRRIESAEAGAPPLQLYAEWLQRWVDWGNHCIARNAESLKKSVLTTTTLTEEHRAYALSMIEDGYFDTAMRLLSGDFSSNDSGKDATRMAGWREQWSRENPQPRQTLKRFIHSCSPSIAESIHSWMDGINQKNISSICSKFRQLLFGRTGTQKRSGLDSLIETFGNRRLIVEASHIHNWLSERDSATFLPQLRSFANLVIIAPGVSPENGDFSRVVSQEIYERDKPKKPVENNIFIILAPGIQESRREQLRQDFRNRKLCAAIIDDLDLLRIAKATVVNSEATVLALLEILLEQQDLRNERLWPFRPGSTGQHINMEMFVGRDDYLDSLFRTNDYSRLFSGRKLGKSSLLQALKQTRDGKQILEGGNTLRVLYVIISGADSEDAVLSEIANVMHREIPESPFHLDKAEGASPGERLLIAMRRWLGENPNQSLLFLLDEADLFVESQVAKYALEAEKCLTFYMGRNLQEETSGGLPRVRFIFSGYRVTNTHEGVWNNWGKVMELPPLGRKDAQDLVVKPLARLGIDARSEGDNIAFRCGMQPAVILSFCYELLSVLRERPNAKMHKVDANLVCAIMERSKVREAIQTIADGNFQQGNPFGRIAFRLFLAEITQLPPGAPMLDAANHLMRCAKKIAAREEGLWNEIFPSEVSAFHEFERALEEMVQRKMLARVDAAGRDAGGEHGYRLSYPHHAPILSDPDYEDKILDNLRELRREINKENYSPHGDRSLLSQRVLAEMREVMDNRDRDLHRDAVLYLTQWPAAAFHRFAGIGDRLHIPDNCQFRVNTAPEPKALPTSSLCELPLYASPDTIKPYLAGGSTPILVGGLDWARASAFLGKVGNVEVFTRGRVQGSQLWWWIRRVRGIEFASKDIVARLLSKTAGIPYLLAALDNHLEEYIGQSMSEDTWKGIETCFFNEAIPEVIRKMTVPGTPQSMLPREVELLRIFATYTFGAGDDWNGIYDAFLAPEEWEQNSEYWRGRWGEHIPFPSPLILDAEHDLPHISALLDTGWLPEVPGTVGRNIFARLCGMQDNDPLIPLLDFVGES